MADVLFASSSAVDADFTSSLGVPLDGIGSAIDSHYTLDEVADPRLDSVGSADMTTGNGTPISISVPGGGVRAGDRALGFTRTNSEYIITSGSSVHDKADEDFVIAGYFRISNKNAPAMSFFSKSTENGNQRGYLLQWDDIADRYRFLVSSDGSSLTTVVASSFGAPSTGVFNYIVCTHDAGSNTISIQVNDGPVDSTAHAGGAFQNTASFAVAMSGDSATGAPSAFMVGFVSELTVFNRLLTAEERSAIYGGGTKDILPYIPNFAFAFSADADFVAGLSEVSFQAIVDVDVDVDARIKGECEGLLDADFIHYWSMNHKGEDATNGRQHDHAGDLIALQNFIIGNPAGQVGNSAEFNGSTNKFTFAGGNSTLNFDGTTDITVCFWANMDAFLDSRAGIVGKYRFSGNQKQWQVSLFRVTDSTARLEILISSDGAAVDGVQNTSVADVSSGGWHFFIAEYREATNTLAVQTDNSTIDTAAAAASIKPTGLEPPTIGTNQVTSVEQFSDGKIDELFIMTKLLTTAQRDALWSGGNGRSILECAWTLFSCSVEFDADFAMGMNDTNLAFDLTADVELAAEFVEVLRNIRQDLISYMPLDEVEGVDKRDVFGLNSPLQEVKPDITQDAAIITGGAPASTNFIGGVGGHLSKSSPVGIDGGAGSFTVGFWARIDGTLAADQGAVSRFTIAGNQRQFTVAFIGTVSQTWRFEVSSDGSNGFAINDDDVIDATGEVHFVLAWYDGDADTVNIQLDDGTVLSAAGPSSIFNATGAHLDIASKDDGTDRIFDGSIQDVAMWARVLSAEERTALYAAGAGVWLERYIPRDLSTFTDMWKCNETTNVALAGVNGTSIPIFGTVPSKAGHVTDPPASLLARGDVRPLGAGADYFAKGFVASDAFDIRGKVSCLFAGWFYVPTGITGNVNFLTIHGEKLNPGGANGQALITQLLASGGPATSPNTFLEDGVTPFSGPGVKADSSAVAVPRDTWQFMAGGLDADRNVGFCFWGRAPAEYYYSEVAAGSVFKATGFAYTGTGTEAGIGEYMFPTPQNFAARFDQLVWFAGTPVAKTFIPRLPSIIELWNQHVGTPQAEMNFAGAELAFAFEADADFVTPLEVVGELSFSFAADADFAMLFREIKFAAQSFVAPDFTAALQVRNLDLSFSSTSDADFTSSLAGTLDGIGTAVDHYWKGEEASGTRFDELNAAGGSINLADINTVGQATGRIGNAPDLVRANSEELDGTASDLDFDGSADFAVLVWVAIDDNVSAPGNIQASIITKWQNPSDRGWGLVYDQSADAFQGVVSTTGSDAFVASSATFISTALALVYMDYDSGTGVIRCSVDNGAKGTNTPGTTINQSTQILRVGSIRLGGSFDDFFDGVIDELIVFNRKLTDAELDAFYAGGAGRNLRDFVVTDLTF